MNMLTKAAITTAVIASLSGVIYADYLGDRWQENDAADVAHASITLDQAVNTALAQTPGIASGARFENRHGQRIWNVEIVSPKGVYDTTVDGASGKVLNQAADSVDYED